MPEVLTNEEYNAKLKQAETEQEEKYEQQEDGSLRCRTCSGEVKVVAVAHPIWNAPFPECGTGQCEYEGTLYCPNCEEKPSSSGLPIAPPGSYHYKEKIAS